MIDFKDWYESLVRYYAERGQHAPMPDDVQTYYQKGASAAETHESLTNQGSTIDVDRQVSELDPSVNINEVALATDDQFAPRLTEKNILAKVKSKSFSLTGSGQTMVCEMVMQNGASIIGLYSPVGDEIVSNEVMQIKALQAALKKVWKFEAYLVREKLYQEWKAAQPADENAVVVR